jgi:hypothetical protein
MAPPGWYRDSTHLGQARYWDGTAWTDQFRPLPSLTPPSDVPAWDAHTGLTFTPSTAAHERSGTRVRRIRRQKRWATIVAFVGIPAIMVVVAAIVWLSDPTYDMFTFVATILAVILGYYVVFMVGPALLSHHMETEQQAAQRREDDWVVLAIKANDLLHGAFAPDNRGDILTAAPLLDGLVPHTRSDPSNPDAGYRVRYSYEGVTGGRPWYIADLDITVFDMIRIDGRFQYHQAATWFMVVTLPGANLPHLSIHERDTATRLNIVGSHITVESEDFNNRFATYSDDHVFAYHFTNNRVIDAMLTAWVPGTALIASGDTIALTFWGAAPPYVWSDAPNFLHAHTDLLPDSLLKATTARQGPLPTPTTANAPDSLLKATTARQGSPPTTASAPDTHPSVYLSRPPDRTVPEKPAPKPPLRNLAYLGWGLFLAITIIGTLLAGPW